MNVYTKYFVIQKLIGVGMIGLTVLSALLLDGDATIGIIMVPLGLYAIFTKEMVIQNRYYFEIKDMERRKRMMRRM